MFPYEIEERTCGNVTYSDGAPRLAPPDGRESNRHNHLPIRLKNEALERFRGRRGGPESR